MADVSSWLEVLADCDEAALENSFEKAEARTGGDKLPPVGDWTVTGTTWKDGNYTPSHVTTGTQYPWVKLGYTVDGLEGDFTKTLFLGPSKNGKFPGLDNLKTIATHVLGSIDGMSLKAIGVSLMESWQGTRQKVKVVASKNPKEYPEPSLFWNGPAGA